MSTMFSETRGRRFQSTHELNTSGTGRPICTLFSSLTMRLAPARPSTCGSKTTVPPRAAPTPNPVQKFLLRDMLGWNGVQLLRLPTRERAEKQELARPLVARWRQKMEKARELL